jgi:hypothetical protein
MFFNFYWNEIGLLFVVLTVAPIERKSKMIKLAKKQYQFTLVLSGFSEITSDLEDALYEAGCDDMLINSRNGVIYLEVDRESANFEEAVLSAIHNVFNAKINVKISSIELSH